MLAGGSFVIVSYGLPILLTREELQITSLMEVASVDGSALREVCGRRAAHVRFSALDGLYRMLGIAPKSILGCIPSRGRRGWT